MGRKRDSRYDDAYQYYIDGLSLDKVAKKIGSTRQILFKAFKRRNYPMRGTNFQPYQIYDEKKFSLRGHGYYELTSGDRKSMHRYVWEKEVGEIPEGWDIHHKNGNKSNNKINNLECLSKSEHTRKYSPHNNQYTKGRVVDKTKKIPSNPTGERSVATEAK